MQDRALTGMFCWPKGLKNSKEISRLVAKIASRCESETEKQRLLAVGENEKTIYRQLPASYPICLSIRGEHDAAVAVAN